MTQENRIFFLPFSTHRDVRLYKDSLFCYLPVAVLESLLVLEPSFLDKCSYHLSSKKPPFTTNREDHHRKLQLGTMQRSTDTFTSASTAQRTWRKRRKKTIKSQNTKTPAVKQFHLELAAYTRLEQWHHQ